jgi:hypothetical protein
VENDIERKLMPLKSDVIVDRFIMEGKEIAVINKDYLGEANGYGFGKIIKRGDELVLVALTDEEYKRASIKYEKIIDLFR